MYKYLNNTHHFSREMHDLIIKRHSEINGDEFLFSLIKPDFQILDVGCGIGNSALILAEKLYEGYVIGVDISEETILKANNEAKKKNIGNINFIVNSADILPFPNSKFDIVYCRNLLMHLENCSEAIKEFKRVVKKGGWVIAFEGDFDTYKFYPEYVGWELFMKFVKKNIATPNMGNKISHLFNQAGFSEITIRAIPNVLKGNDLKHSVMSWIMALEGYSEFLIKTKKSDKKTISSIVKEGYNLYNNPIGSFYSVEYEVIAKCS